MRLQKDRKNHAAFEPRRYNLNMYKIYRYKKAILILTAIFVSASWAELLWIRQLGSQSFSFEKYQFGIFILPWIFASIGFLLLMYIYWFKPGLPKGKIKTAFFSILSLSMLVVWCGILFNFVF